jgi:hypothetical protein
MSRETTCYCALCEIELRLLTSLAFERLALPQFGGPTEPQGAISVTDLVLVLKSSPTKAQSDQLLGQLLELRVAQPMLVDSLLVLAFVPMLHRTIRRIVTYQPSLVEDDVVQQALRVLLEFLGSDELRARQSHYAFAISRAIKRQLFAWAEREGIKEQLSSYPEDACPPVLIEEPFERHAELRHFLHRCTTRGELTDSELDLLVQSKLEGNNGDLHSSNETTSNATRQKLKRLLAKLRRLAE